MRILEGQTRQVNRTLNYSILDGSAHAAMLGLTQDYVVPFALALKATTTQVGLLASVPNFLMSLSQLAAPRLVERAGSRKGLILPAVFVHALMWLPILLIPYFFPGERIWWLIAFVTLSAIFGSLGNPAWGSLMADLVPEGRRGKFFGLRGRIAGFLTLLFFFIGGAILHFSAANRFLGFSILFGGAALFRLASGYFLSRMDEPPLSRTDQAGSLIQLARGLTSSNLGRFVLYVSLMSLATHLAGPFFAVYMLRDLQFNYLTYVLIMATATVTNFVFLTFWGRRGDRVGNIKVVKITSFLIPLVPVLWLGGHQVYYLLLIQVLAGFAWAGFNLATINFLYDASAPQQRTQWIALFNALNGSAICLGALLGGLLAPHLPAILGNSYSLPTLFLISGVARGLVVIALLRHIYEVRQVPRTGAAELLFGRLKFVRSAVRNMVRSFRRVSRVSGAAGALPFSRSAVSRTPVTTGRSPPS